MTKIQTGEILFRYFMHTTMVFGHDWAMGISEMVNPSGWELDHPVAPNSQPPHSAGFQFRIYWLRKFSVGTR